MKLPRGTEEYQRSIIDCKNELMRLKKGKTKIKEALDKREIVRAVKLLDLWDEVSSNLFEELEKVILIHQHYAMNKSLVVRSDGTLVKIEDLINGNPEDYVEVDPFILTTIEKLKGVFGDDVHDLLDITKEEPPEQ